MTTRHILGCDGVDCQAVHDLGQPSIFGGYERPAGWLHVTLMVAADAEHESWSFCGFSCAAEFLRLKAAPLSDWHGLLGHDGDEAGAS